MILRKVLCLAVLAAFCGCDSAPKPVEEKAAVKKTKENNKAMSLEAKD